MELKKSLIERFYIYCVQNDWYAVRRLIHKMRDAFYENFNDLIEKCKDLL